MTNKTPTKKEILEIATECCDLLEKNRENEFFNKLECILIQKIPFGKLHPLGEYIGERGLKNPELYFPILDKFFKKEINYGYHEGIYDTSRIRMSEEEIQKSRVWGWRAGIVGLAFNKMSHEFPEEVVQKTYEYIILSSHWSSSDTFADKTFNLMFEERFEWILKILKMWIVDENKWIRNTATFTLHAPVERNLLNQSQYLQILEVMDIAMEDEDKNVKKKAAWALKVMGKYYPTETYNYLLKWAKTNNKTARWIVKNSLKFLGEKQKNSILKLF